MHLKRFLLPGIISSLFLVAPARAGSVTLQGSSVLHYMTRNNLAVTDAGSNIVAALRLQFNEEGNALVQKFDLTATNLLPSQPYSMFAVLGDDTNAVAVAAFNSDAAGRARVSFMSTKSGSSDSVDKKPLPALLNPLLNVRAIGIAQFQTQTLAYAWINTSTQYQYLVKRNLTPANTNGTAAGSINLKGNPTIVNFKLKAGGLTPTNSYYLALNSNIVSSVTSDTKGRLQISKWPTNAPTGLSLQLLQLLDSGSNAVLSTTLPK
jgi:hypothetical protein